MLVVNSITGETRDTFMSEFFIEKVDWSDPENPIVTETNFPFQLAYSLVGREKSIIEVTKLPETFGLRELMRTKATVRLKKGQKIRKIAKEKRSAKARIDYKEQLQHINGLSQSSGGDVNDKELLDIPDDIELEDITIGKVGAMLIGTAFNSPETATLAKGGKSTKIRVRSLVGTDKPNEGPSESTFYDVKTDFTTFDADQPEDAEEHAPSEAIEPPIDENGIEEEEDDPPLDDQGARRVTMDEIEEIITELRLNQVQRDNILGGGN